MRNYVEFEAGQRHQPGAWGFILRLWANRRARSDLRRLQAMDDHVLRDMGLSRADIDRLVGLPHTVDLVWEAERARARKSIPSPKN